MQTPETFNQKIHTLPSLLKEVYQWKFFGKKIAFTNGCFDILHAGHIYSLNQAAAEGDILVVGINSDASVRQLKGAGRPVNGENERALVLASLSITDAIIIFDDETPLNLIRAIMPDVLVKGGDYTADQIAGAKEVIEAGGRVVINNLLEGFSTTSIINKSQQ